MATKKKSKKKPTRSKKTASRKASPALKKVRSVARKKSAKKTAAPTKTAAPKKKKKSLKKKSLKKTVSAKPAVLGTDRTPKKSQGGGSAAFSREMPNPRSGAQSGDLQGLSDVESADSESVDELIEEGNSFEAGVVTGVEDAGERGTREVHTREVLEDDVPGEYLDKD
jgi:hypothetical protein